MIVNWKKPKAGLKVIPIQVMDAEGKQKITIGYLTLLPGFNHIPDEDWKKSRACVLSDPEAEWIEEVLVSSTIKPEKEEKVMSVDSSSIERNVENLVEFLKKNDIYTYAVEFAAKGEKEFGKDSIEEFISNHEEVSSAAAEHFSVDKEVFYVSVNISDLPAVRAAEIVKDTWNLGTLNSWRSFESRDEIRSLILNQIEIVENPTKKSKEVSESSTSVVRNVR